MANSGFNHKDMKYRIIKTGGSYLIERYLEYWDSDFLVSTDRYLDTLEEAKARLEEFKQRKQEREKLSKEDGIVYEEEF